MRRGEDEGGASTSMRWVRGWRLARIRLDAGTMARWNADRAGLDARSCRDVDDLEAQEIETSTAMIRTAA
jgi:hypothetical protein